MDDAHTLTPPWLPEHAQTAAREGWDLFDCGDHWELQRIDSPDDDSEPLQDDGMAWEIVLKGTHPHHRAAQEFLRTHALEEWEGMLQHARNAQIIATLRHGGFV